jgi:replicative superfamily II helicase
VSDYWARKSTLHLFCLAQPQIVGMSATLANIGDLLKFLDAQFYEERFRPVWVEVKLGFGDDIDVCIG